MKMQVVTNVEQIFTQGNLHMANKLKHFGKQGQKVVKYIISKLRKYRGEFFECNKTIADNVGCSVRTVQNAIKRAEQLEIFVVTSRKEQTLNGKLRQTSNKIQLLSYGAVEVVKEVVEEVRQVASGVAKVVKKVFTPKRENKPKSSQYKPYNSQYTRSEIVPQWISKPQTSTTNISPEQQQRFNRLKDRLKNKYQKKGDTNESRN